MMERYRGRRSPAMWNPFREMEEMERRMNEAFGRPTMRRRSPEDIYVWAPSIEMYEKDNNYIVRMELPGIKPEDVDISVSGETLTVKGQRTPPEDIKDEAYQLCETCYGEFSRSIILPESVDADKIEANFENGILDLRIPKAEEAKPRQIKVQSRSSQSQISQSQSRTSGSQGSMESSESVAGTERGVSENEQQQKGKTPYEG